MAIIKNNPLLQGISGTIGGMVFRQRNGKTIVTSKPYRSKKKTANQTAHQARFLEAVMYAKTAVVEENSKKHYADFANMKNRNRRPVHRTSKFERETKAYERLLFLSRRMNTNPLYSTIEAFVKEKHLDNPKT